MVLRHINIDMDKIINTVNNLEGTIGRMEIVNYNKSLIIVDYAHTEDAVFKIINCVREYTKGKIYCIIGCGGNRQKSKRSKMAYYATTLSDYVILTNDNPRLEDEDEIINDMISGIVKNNYEVIKNRKEAIEKSISYLKDYDTLLILGKGHENYQIIGSNVYHHNDIECVKNVIDRVI